MIERVIVKYQGDGYTALADVIKESAYVSLIRFTMDGVDYEIVVPNDELEELFRIPLVAEDNDEL